LCFICYLEKEVYCDNLYTSANLFIELKKKGFEAAGTVKINRLGMNNIKKNEIKSINLSNRGNFESYIGTYLH